MGFLASLGVQGCISLFLQLWPVAVSAVHAAETLMPQAGAGKTKFNTVLDQITKVAIATPQVVGALQSTGQDINHAINAPDAASLTTAIGSVINVAVALGKATGTLSEAAAQGATIQANPVPDNTVGD